jgi:general secretion pathway protein H
MRRRKSLTGESGFTLLELLVTMTVAALLLTVVGPRIADTVAHAALKASASRVVAALREARWEAMKTSQASAFVVSGSGRGYIIADKTTTLPSGQTVSLIQYNKFAINQEPQIEFLPDGSSSGGTITIAAGADRIRVDVDWLSGRVTSSE